MGDGPEIGAKELLLKRMQLFPREFIDETPPKLGAVGAAGKLDYCEVPSAWGMRAIPKVSVVWLDVLQRLAYSLNPVDWEEVSDALRRLVYDSACGSFYERLRIQHAIPATKRIVGRDQALTPDELGELQVKLSGWYVDRVGEVTCYEDWDGDYVVGIRDEKEWVEYEVSKDQIGSPYKNILHDLCNPTIGASK